ncbi:MAG: hypothetical protein B9J98_00630 [Candidatus Terraquivivens tikiterensis]|uniref:Uncharacterized protein n=1 Tax=Candidatus Terraquivivens tikiterensis TaxID=1980982 RepID=A0A2R7YBV8_9ARCH|nr:MAG: hypothetical protein B9J98_00630 [Candidatus Terraquivivens tikiterensis]
MNYELVPLIVNIQHINTVNLQANSHGWINITEAFNLNVPKQNLTVFFKLLGCDVLEKHFTSLVVQIVIHDEARAVVTLPLKLLDETVKNVTLPEDYYCVDVRMNYVAGSVSAEGEVSVAVWASEESNLNLTSPKTYYEWLLNYTIQS